MYEPGQSEQSCRKVSRRYRVNRVTNNSRESGAGDEDAGHGREEGRRHGPGAGGLEEVYGAGRARRSARAVELVGRVNSPPAS